MAAILAMALCIDKKSYLLVLKYFRGKTVCSLAGTESRDCFIILCMCFKKGKNLGCPKHLDID